MEWKTELSLQLIDEYRKQPVLWYSKNGSYYSKSKKQSAWETIARNLSIDVTEVRQKMNSLLGSFRREKSRGRRIVGKGTASEKMYVSKWFAFEPMSFLLYKDQFVPPIDDTLLSIPQEEKVETGEEIFLNEDSHHQSNLFPPPQSTDDVNITEDNKFPSFQPQRKSRTKKSTTTADHRIKEAIGILKSVVATPDDTCSIFGKYISQKLRNYDSRTRAIVEHSINNVLFDADMGKFEQNDQQFLMSSPSLSPALSPVLSASNSLYSPQHQQPESPSPDIKMIESPII